VLAKNGKEQFIVSRFEGLDEINEEASEGSAG
jgi:hypothetical protein